MIVPDVNLLLYAHFTGFSQHGAARKWWEDTLNGDAPVGLAAPALFGFVRVATSPRAFADPMSVEAALSTAQTWLARPGVHLLLPGPRHLAIAFGFLRALGAAANLTTDAQLAALAVENQAELHSNDTDFARFAGLRWRNPLTKGARR